MRLDAIKLKVTQRRRTEVRTTLERLKARKGDEGFTLIELLIVIIILAILATIVIFAVGTTTKNAAIAACKSTVKTVETAVEAYAAQTPTGTYPATLTVLLKKDATGNGPWLKEAPSATVKKNGYAIGYTAAATGKVTVKTATGTTCTTA
jgi:prepilin-type N-terminal cleavage/methylation domain-containing protein